MTGIRSILLRHRRLAALLLALTLCLKALVPAGYMMDSGSSTLTMRICDGQTVKLVEVAIPSSKGASGSADPQLAGDCAYGALSMGALSVTDLAILAAQLAFVLLLGFAPLAAPAVRRTPFASPPQRGPPALA